MRHTKAQALILATLTATAIAPASANEFRWGVGLGGILEDSGYKGVSSETNLLPILYIETERFRLVGPSAEFDLYSGSDFEFSLIGQYRADGYEKGDGDIFAGMEDRDDSLERSPEERSLPILPTRCKAPSWSTTTMAFVSQRQRRYARSTSQGQ